MDFKINNVQRVITVILRITCFNTIKQCRNSRGEVGEWWGDTPFNLGEVGLVGQAITTRRGILNARHCLRI